MLFLQTVPLMRYPYDEGLANDFKKIKTNPRIKQVKTCKSLFILLKIDVLFKFKVGNFAYCYIKYKTPNSVSHYFCKTNNRPMKATRQSADCDSLQNSCYRTDKLQKCIKSILAFFFFDKFFEKTFYFEPTLF